MMTRTGWKHLLDGTASVFMIMASAAIVWTAVSPGLGTQKRRVSPTMAENVEVKQWRISASALGTRPARARVAVVEFSDFECPFCRRYSRDTLPMLKKEFVDSGKIAYIFKNNPLEAVHSRARDMAIDAICAGEQGRFWDAHHLLFKGPRDIAGTPDAIAEGLGMDPVKYEACLKRAPDRLQSEITESTLLGVMGTPTFFLGELANDNTVSVRRRIRGAQSFEVFREAIEELLATGGS